MSDREAQEWILLADHDADTARLLAREGGHPEIVVYHLHQATEKYMKALAARARVAIERTHHLDRILSSLIDSYPSLSRATDGILELHLYYPRLRYPSGERITFGEARALLNTFETISRVIGSLLSQDT